MWLAAANIWTGSPLFALWVGSRLQGSGPPKMSSIAAVVIVLESRSKGPDDPRRFRSRKERDIWGER